MPWSLVVINNRFETETRNKRVKKWLARLVKSNGYERNIVSKQ